MSFHVQYAGILDFKSIYDFVAGFVPESMGWMAFTVAAVALALIVINALVMCTAVYTWFERRTLGRFQNRLGPNRWGPFGILQPIADLVKLITKEDTTPEEADRWVMTLAPNRPAGPDADSRFGDTVRAGQLPGPPEHRHPVRAGG